MVLTVSSARQILVIGIIEIVAATICVICGIVALSKMTSPAAVTVGIWALYYGVPAGLCVAAGYYKNEGLMGGALAANIVGIILAGIGLIVGAIFWTWINVSCFGNSNYYYRYEGKDNCVCADGFDTSSYDASCDDVRGTIRNTVAASTIMYVILGVVTFIGSIFGCIYTCCAQRESGVVIATTAQPQTVIVTTQNQGYPAQGYPAQGYPAQGYPAQGYPAQGYPNQGYPPGYGEPGYQPVVNEAKTGIQ